MRSRSLRGLIDASLKRGLDLALAATSVAVLVPTTPLLALAIRIETKGPVFFGCARLGRGGRAIKIWKFRTMVDAAPERFNPDGSRLVETNDPRVTRVGAFLRGGLDELPQAFSVLRGDLSFVGPRPDDLYAVDLYRGAEWLKLAVTPGITGLAQVNGRNDLPHAERLKYDIYYALHRDLWLDVRIIARTLGQALGWQPETPLVDHDVVEQVATSTIAAERAVEIEREARARAEAQGQI